MMKQSQPSTSALLQKVTSQLKGERVAVKEHDVDDLEAYIASMAQKTSQRAVDYDDDDNDYDYDDHQISMSNGTYYADDSPRPSSRSRFLKKNKVDSRINQVTAKVNQGTTKPTPIPPGYSPWMKSMHSPSMNKASELTGNHQNKASEITNNPQHKHDKASEITNSRQNKASVISNNLQIKASEITNNLQIKASEITNSRQQKSFHTRPDIYDLDLTESDDSYKVLINNLEDASSGTEPPSLSVTEKSGIGRDKKVFEKSKTNQAALKVDNKVIDTIEECTTKPLNVGINQLIDAQLKDNTSGKLLSSSGKLVTSSGDPFYKADRTNSKTLSNKDKVDLSVTFGSPFYRNNSSKNEQNEKPSEDLLFDAGSKPNTSPFYSDMGKQKHSKTKTVKDKPSVAPYSVLDAFGLHSVQELMMPGSDDKSVVSSVSDINSEKSVNLHDKYATESEILSDSRPLHWDFARKHAHTHANRSHRKKRHAYSVQSEGIVTDLELTMDNMDKVSTPVSEVQTENFSERDDDRNTRNNTDDYTEEHTEDFSLGSRNEGTVTDYTYSDRFDSRRDESKSLVKMTSVEVQTNMPVQYYTQYAGIPMSNFQLGYEFVDPTPLACHIVSHESAEGMARVSPTSLVLHDMVKQQLHLTQRFLHVQKALYDRWTQGLEDHTFQYTTLEDTKMYIEKQRKKRLTFKDALKLVKSEMD